MARKATEKEAFNIPLAKWASQFPQETHLRKSQNRLIVTATGRARPVVGPG